MCLSTVQISNASQRLKKASGSAAYDLVKFKKCNEGYKLVHVRNRCRKRNFSVFRLQPFCAFMSSMLIVE
jgi:hypothetical protein